MNDLKKEESKSRRELLRQIESLRRFTDSLSNQTEAAKYTIARIKKIWEVAERMRRGEIPPVEPHLIEGEIMRIVDSEIERIDYEEYACRCASCGWWTWEGWEGSEAERRYLGIPDTV